MKMHRSGRLGGSSGTDTVGVPLGWPFDCTQLARDEASQPWDQDSSCPVRGGRELRQESSLTNSRGADTHSCPETACLWVSRG